MCVRETMTEDYVEEACFYLAELKVEREKISRALNLTPDQVTKAIESYGERIKNGSVEYDDNAKEFWAKNYKESSGDERVTLVDDKGRYYHGWKSELEGLPSEKLVELLVVNKQYSDKHPLSEFSKGEAIIGYDPLVPLRNIRRTVSLLEQILVRKEGETGSPNK
jgi:hypothetical protein